MSKFDNIYLKMEDGTKLEGMVKETSIKSEVEMEKPIFPEDGYYHFDMDLNPPKCFLDYQRYLIYHLNGYDIQNVPFFRKYFKLND